jgi:uncharacterized protein (UPF0276 family)
MGAAPRSRSRPSAIPRATGIGLRAPHFREILTTRPPVRWLEVHSENFFCAGGPPHWFLEQLRAHYPLSLHGVGLGLGSSDPLSELHLANLARLIARYEPALVSEHLSWSAASGRHLNDLLPLPYTEEALDHVCARIDTVQNRLGRQILIENVSSYLRFKHSTIPEWEFLAATARRAGCGILLDVNNVYVNAANHGFDPHRYLAAIPAEVVQEIHLAGFDSAPSGVLVDTHGKPVHVEVWPLYKSVVARFGPRPTLIEWDTDLPALEVLLAEARKAQDILEGDRAVAH